MRLLEKIFDINSVLNLWYILLSILFLYRVAEWGGGYPRPFVEAIEDSWRAAPDDKDGVEIDDEEYDELVREEREYRDKLERIAKKKREKKRKEEEARKAAEEKKRKIDVSDF